MNTDTLDVRIVKLEPMRVATVYGYGQEPEDIAWKKMRAWARQRGFWLDNPARRYFGFDNPGSNSGTPNRGYEVWMTVGPEVESEGEITVKEFTGGLYAVTHCEVHNPWDDIPPTWKKLVAWVETSPYHNAHHQWLEEHFFTGDLDPANFALDLYLPIR